MLSNCTSRKLELHAYQVQRGAQIIPPQLARINKQVEQLHSWDEEEEKIKYINDYIVQVSDEVWATRLKDAERHR